MESLDPNKANQALPRLFLFCIGGTGVRILKALTFLLASGVEIKASQVIPIIIDPDASGGDLNRTVELLNKYRSIRKSLEFSKNQFYHTDIQTLSSLDTTTKGSSMGGVLPPSGFKFNIDGTKDGKFRNFIAYDQLDQSNKSLVDVLFSEDNLNAELKVGFKGNPHMGSVVLNQFKESNDFKYFAAHFNKNDRVFIMSSIFGGTGAAGFPLLVKNIREADRNLAGNEFLRNSIIGALSVLPYFGVKPNKKSKIDKGTFISKTKAALQYYADNLTGNNSLNAMYYLGDTPISNYDNHEGGTSQKNDAHLIELLSAMSIVDFMDMSPKLATKDSRAIDPVYKEYGINGDVKNLSFRNLGQITRNRVMKGLTQYTYVNTYIRQQLESSLNKMVWSKGSKPSATKIDSSFISGDFYSGDLQQFNARFMEWLMEMSRNQRGFTPFKLDINKDQLNLLVNDIVQKKMGFLKGNTWDYDSFDGLLNESEKLIPEWSVEQKFMAIFYEATHQIYTERIAPQL